MSCGQTQLLDALLSLPWLHEDALVPMLHNLASFLAALATVHPDLREMTEDWLQQLEARSVEVWNLLMTPLQVHQCGSPQREAFAPDPSR
eukprot:6136449-Amphidinium_carterae.1